MSVPHNAIPWLRMRGPGGAIDHAVYGSSGGWWTTCCSHWTPSGVEHREPKRKCRACVSFLRTATLAVRTSGRTTSEGGKP